MRLAAFLLSVQLLLSATARTQTFSVTGSVRDASTGEPLPAANIRIEGTARGTITNRNGEFALSLERGRYNLIISFVGYKSDTLSLSVQSNIHKEILLTPTPIQMAEIVVTDEDPAVRIMRKVIENKKRWIDGLKTYQLEAFTRQVLRRDTSIASIMESYSTGYWQSGDTLREVVKQKRQTENIPMAQNFAAVGGIVNFYQDEIRLSGYRFIGPTAKEAFDWYSFKLLHTLESDEEKIFVIQMIPKSRVVPLFKGTISVIDQSFSVVAVQVSPNEAYVIPFIREFDFRYAQQFALYAGEFWMPVDIRINGRAKISLLGFSIPPFGFEQISSIYDYKINIELPDTVFWKPRRVVAPEAEKLDSLYWIQHEVLPLTREEQRAYATLDSTQTLQKQFRPSGALAEIGSISTGALRFFDLRYNRVEGLFAGGKARFDSVLNWLSVEGSLGYGLSNKRSAWRFGAQVFLDARRLHSVGLAAFKQFHHIPDEGFHDPLTISLNALFSKEDYRDYYDGSGWTLFVKSEPIRKIDVRFSFTQEDQRSASTNARFSLFRPGKNFRSNPVINEGRLRTLSARTRIGDEPFLFGFFSRKFLEIDFEYSSWSFLKSDFDFKRLLVRGEYQIVTFLSRYAFPPALYVRLAAGTSSGSLPLQRTFAIESNFNGYAPFGVMKGAKVKEFAGDRFVSLSLEHNFRSAPFLALDIPYLYEENIELLIHGSVARAWSSSDKFIPIGKPTDGWYTEAGMGIGRIFDLLRADLTYRFLQPRGIAFSISLSRFF